MVDEGIPISYLAPVRIVVDKNGIVLGNESANLQTHGALDALVRKSKKIISIAS
jgi:hypothetical protein